MPVPVEATAHFVRSVPGQLCEVPDLKITQVIMRYVFVGGIAESIKLFIEDQAFIDSDPRPLRPPPLPAVNKLPQSSCVPPVELTDERGVGWRGGRGAKTYDRQKTWSSINHSIISGVQ
jgi:hypothetical protein